jgi:drug/metabolite transporter (DMT)-like permease
MAAPSGSGASPGALARPPAADLAWLGIAVLFISSSGPIIAATVAPALAIAFWRCFLGSAATSLVVIARHVDEVRRMTRREWWLVASAGLLLGAHFATWIPSLRFTTVASSTALVATQPVWAALIARQRGARIPRTAWVGITVSLVGVLVLTGVDISVDPRHLIGDLLALAGAVLAAAYVTVAESARRTVSTATMTAGLYASAGMLLLVLCIVGRQPLTDYSSTRGSSSSP